MMRWQIVNIRAAFFLTRSVAARLIAAKRLDRSINISSQMAHVGGIDRAVYCATKHAVEGFTKAMAMNGGRIRYGSIPSAPPLSAPTLTAPPSPIQNAKPD